MFPVQALLRSRTFHPTASDSWVNGLWLVSLSLSLTTALFAVLTKQWIHQYMSVPSGTPRDRCRVRQFRFMGLERWRVDLIIGMLPVLMSLSLGVFLAGLVLFLIPLRVPIASAVGSIAFTSFAAYFITNFLPIIYPSCPYRTPLVQYMFPVYAYANRLHGWIISRFFRRRPPGNAEAEKPTGHTTETSGVVLEQPIRSLRAAEHAAVGLSADDIDLYALSWLFEISSNPSVHNIVVQSLSALPLRSVNSLVSQGESTRHQSMDSLMSRLEESALENIIRELLRSLDDMRDVPFIKRELSRYIRIYLRFTATPGFIYYMPAVEMLPPGTCAALQSVDIYWYEAFSRTSLPDRVITALREGEDSTDKSILCLQPIVWASILRRLHPLGSSINVSLLLNEIPTSFWHPMFSPPPLVFTSGALRRLSRTHIEPEIASILTGLKISSPSPPVDKPVPLCIAIRTCLYQYVFETIILGHEDIRNIRGSVDYLGPTNEFPEPPQDPKLCFLLQIAGEPSLWDMPKVTGEPNDRYPYSRTLIGRVLLNIGVYLDVNKFSLIDECIPSFGLDVNRHAVLKLLYEMISSADFGNGRPAYAKDCRIALLIFLRVLNSTSHRPRFLPKDWCTPELAAKSVRIAFEDDEWRSCQYEYEVIFEEDNQRFTPATELALHFFSSPPIINQAVGHFVHPAPL
ncbi:hypothetical protein EV421DRAFT_600584 [Armillaria borealis]|uniref:DUF6535 domain-containing protein n=1 Tax=Armillaria borealis TaxID=47425 RepID=A0AA39MPE6_9AGAR|nr:hypothetical protein EV421DRAFT_600584 [Armillaria borealis]